MVCFQDVCALWTSVLGWMVRVVVVGGARQVMYLYPGKYRTLKGLKIAGKVLIGCSCSYSLVRQESIGRWQWLGC